MAVWKGYSQGKTEEEDLCALLFNAMGMLHEILKKKSKGFQFKELGYNLIPEKGKVLLPTKYKKVKTS